jgi:uncharacterized protein YhjY with autotransporter beta-barrel domain
MINLKIKVGTRLVVAFYQNIFQVNHNLASINKSFMNTSLAFSTTAKNLINSKNKLEKFILQLKRKVKDKAI